MATDVDAKSDETEPLEIENGETSSPQKHRDLKDTPLAYRLWELVRVILPAACYSFGGPNAHLAIFQDLFVEKLHWLTDQEFMDLLALGMTLPGPTSSEFCIAVGTYRAGLLGALVTFICWTAPSLIVMLVAGLGASHMNPKKTPDWMNGLAPAATVLIFIAFYRLGRKIVDTKLKAYIALGSALITLLIQNETKVPARTIMWLLPVMLIVGGSLTLGQYFYGKRAAAAAAAEKREERESEAANNGGEEEGGGASSNIALIEEEKDDQQATAMGRKEMTSDTYDSVPVPKWFGIGCVAFIAAFLLYLLITSSTHQKLDPYMKVFSSFFIVGITIYGGGQVMLPLLISVAVDPGWLTMDQFLVGFALVQMLPGPLSNLAAYIGAIYMGVGAAFIAVIGFFLPGILLVIAFLPLWDRIRKIPNVRPFLAGVNAAGIGLILAVGVALYLKVVRDPADAFVTVVTGFLIGYMNYSSMIGVPAGALIGFLLSPTCINIGQQHYNT